MLIKANIRNELEDFKYDKDRNEKYPNTKSTGKERDKSHFLLQSYFTKQWLKILNPVKIFSHFILKI